LQPGDPREIGPYQLRGQLGRGGMGQVFLGMSAGGRPIAVKVIRTELAADPEFRARFRREVAAARKVSGLFTALVIDADLDSPMPWLATAYVAGPTLTEAVGQLGPLSVRTVLALTAGLAESLSAIHAAGVVHGDLKPSNVLLAEDGPRVIDFGIAQAAEASAAARTDLTIGSPGFMSPEQVLNSDLSPASDLFSLGAVLTFAATGQGPFGSGSPAALMYRLVNSPANLDGVPAELRQLVGSCLAKLPGDRPTARELLNQVGAIQPAPGWFAESIIAGFAQDRSAVGSSGAGSLPALTGAVSAKPRPISRKRPGRHRISRPVASAYVSGGLVAASALAVFALTGANRPPGGGSVQPQAGAGAVATAPSSAPSSASSALISPRPSSSAKPLVAPNAYLTPTLTPTLSMVVPQFVATSSGASQVGQSTTSPSSSASPSKSSSASSSASPSKSTSPSASPSASSSPSPAPSSSPSPAPSSPAPSSSASATPSSPAASSSPSAAPSTAPASSSPSAAPSSAPASSSASAVPSSPAASPSAAPSSAPGTATASTTASTTGT
jgi:serine/threonine protein kinase